MIELENSILLYFYSPSLLFSFPPILLSSQTMSAFRTVRAEPFAGLQFVTVKSSHLQGRGDLLLYVPDVPEASDLPLVILLHGVYSSYWAWAVKGRAHQTAQDLIDAGHIRPMVLAMPSDGLAGDGTGYLPHSTANYERWIVDDVPQAVREVVPQVSAQSPLCLAGLSMGGYGALRLGACYGERFAALAAHSSVTTYGELLDFLEEETLPVTTDLLNVIDACRRHRTTLPPLRFDCGTDDPLLAANRLLHRQLQTEGLAHDYVEYPGDHTWDYWSEHLADTLRFFHAAVDA